MASTIPLIELEKYVDNVYEAVVVIAKRAKQINEEQRRLFEINTDDYDDDDSEDFDEEGEAPAPEEIHYVKLPKPTRIALEELMSGQLKCEYIEREENS
jgi:DNA-directed RNA polymerase subunit K/omega